MFKPWILHLSSSSLFCVIHYLSDAFRKSNYMDIDNIVPSYGWNSVDHTQRNFRICSNLKMLYLLLRIDFGMKDQCQNYSVTNMCTITLQIYLSLLYTNYATLSCTCSTIILCCKFKNASNQLFLQKLLNKQKINTCIFLSSAV